MENRCFDMYAMSYIVSFFLSFFVVLFLSLVSTYNCHKNTIPTSWPEGRNSHPPQPAAADAQSPASAARTTPPYIPAA